MAPKTAKRLLFNSIPEEYPVPGQTLKLENYQVDIEDLKLNGGVVLQTLVLSLDPYMRGRMRDPNIPSYVPAFEIGKPLINFGVARVIKSENDIFKNGDLVYGILPFEEIIVLTGRDTVEGLTKLQNKEGLPLTKWVGPAGMPGMTAHYGLYEIGEPKKGDTIFISAAAGAVGQIVGGLAKREGLRVIGSVGSDQKVELMKNEFGFDHVFNYKKQSTLDELRKFEPIQIYFDNVGGPILDDFLLVGDKRARIVGCGAISQYNTKEKYGVKNLMSIVSRSMKFQGFVILDVAEPKYVERFYSEVPKWVAEGSLKTKEDVTVGLENAERAFIGMLKGENVGKAVVKVAD